MVVSTYSGSTLIYNSFNEQVTVDPDKGYNSQGVFSGDVLGMPSLRIIRANGVGADELFVRGAYSAAIRHDSTVAFVRGVTEPLLANTPYEGVVEVAACLQLANCPPQVWSAAGRYQVVAWAGQRLLAYHSPDAGRQELVVFDQPGSPRVLSQGSLIALNPAGDLALVKSAENGGVSIRDVATGAEVAGLGLQDMPGVASVSSTGAWAGTTAAARADGGIALFSISRSGRRIEFSDVVPVDPEAHPAGAIEPQLDPTGRFLTAVIVGYDDNDGSDEEWMVSCDLDLLSMCPAPGIDTLGPGLHHPIYNPSRPIATVRM